MSLYTKLSRKLKLFLLVTDMNLQQFETLAAVVWGLLFRSSSWYLIPRLFAIRSWNSPGLPLRSVRIEWDHLSKDSAAISIFSFRITQPRLAHHSYFGIVQRVDCSLPARLLKVFSISFISSGEGTGLPFSLRLSTSDKSLCTTSAKLISPMIFFCSWRGAKKKDFAHS